jgi:hypothetical protein
MRKIRLLNVFSMWLMVPISAGTRDLRLVQCDCHWSFVWVPRREMQLAGGGLALTGPSVLTIGDLMLTS